MLNIFRTPKVTRARIWMALVVAIVTDVLQLISGPFGWVMFDQILDVIAMVATSYLLGFNLLLLPTFVLELIPMADWLPTWTGCVALLASMRKKEQAAKFRAEETAQLRNSNLSGE